jgi:pseudaminic acid synthase
MNTKTFIIAELSANHNGSLKTALESVKAIKKMGADAVKLQTYTPDTITMDVKTDIFRIQGSHWDGQYLYDLYKNACTPWEWHKEIFNAAKQEGLLCFSSPFDYTAVDFLEKLNCPIYKIASMEITDIQLIKYAASKKKPMIISTGIADKEDILLAIKTCQSEGNNDITLLKCTSEYPAPHENTNLLTMRDFQTEFGVKIGLSDHTMGIEAPIAAVALGATVIEKHFILNKKIGGPDAHFSLDYNEFKLMIDSVRKVEKMMGIVSYELTEKQLLSRKYARSLFISKDVEENTIITTENIQSVRPSDGIAPKHLKDVIGKRFNKGIKKGVPLSWDDID